MNGCGRVDSQNYVLRLAKAACCIFLACTFVAWLPFSANAADYRYVAHQGKVNSHFKGNTIPAFEQAAATDGIFGIETDIWRTADGEYVCLHGEDPGATWAGMDIWSTDLATLQSQTVEDYVLPTLGDYLEICKSGGKYAFIEIKNPELAENREYCMEVVQDVYEHDMLSQCVFVAHFSRAMAVSYLQECAREQYGIDVLAHIGSGKTYERVDEAIAFALEHGLDGIGTYPDIAPQRYAFEKVKGTGLTLRSTGAIKNEAHARELIEEYDLWAVYCEFKPKRYKVVFRDGVSGETISIDKVVYGAAADSPQPPEHEGVSFQKWDKPFSEVTDSIVVTAQYSDAGVASEDATTTREASSVTDVIEPGVYEGMRQVAWLLLARDKHEASATAQSRDLSGLEAEVYEVLIPKIRSASVSAPEKREWIDDAMAVLCDAENSASAETDFDEQTFMQRLHDLEQAAGAN